MFKYQIRGENIAVTDAIREYAERKISKLEKYFDSQDATVHVNADENLPFETDGEKDVETDELQIARTKQIEPQAMTPQEAALQMELLGHDFHIFHIQDANSIGLTYRRQDGTIGLLEVALPEHKCGYEPVGEEVW